MGLLIDWQLTNPYIEVVHAQEVVAAPQEVRIGVVIDWNKDRIEKEVRSVFPEEPNTAVAVFTCESGLEMIQSNMQLSYGRELSFCLAQIHEPDWGDDAIKLGLNDWKNDIPQCLQLARHVYDTQGKGSFWPWTVYKTGEYKTCL